MHLPCGITQCYLPPHTSEHTPPYSSFISRSPVANINSFFFHYGICSLWSDLSPDAVSRIFLGFSVGDVSVNCIYMYYLATTFSYRENGTMIGCSWESRDPMTQCPLCQAFTWPLNPWQDFSRGGGPPRFFLIPRVVIERRTWSEFTEFSEWVDRITVLVWFSDGSMSVFQMSILCRYFLT